MFHDESPLFAGIPQDFTAVRYHSLRASTPLPAAAAALRVDGRRTVMGLRHRERPLWGVQFHPESICTEHGQRLLVNFRDLTPRVAPRGAVAPAGPAGAAAPAAAATSRSHWRRIDRLVDPETAFMRLYGDAALRVLARQLPRLGRAVALLVHRRRAAAR